MVNRLKKMKRTKRNKNKKIEKQIQKYFKSSTAQ